MSKDKTQLLRLIFIDRKIRDGMKKGKLANCSTMAAGYEVSTKSIWRDIDYLKNQQNAPIEYDPKKRGYYYTEEKYALPAIHISESDLFAICIAEKALKQHENTPIYKKLVSVFQKIEQSLPDRITVDPSWIDQRLSVIRDRSTRIDPLVWDTVASGLHKNRVLRIQYQKPGDHSPTERKVAPYHVASFQGEWYLAGHCHLRKKVLTFAISRIREARILKEQFEIPADFDLSRFSENRFGIFNGTEQQSVKIRFNRKTAPYIREREWHPHQEISENKDGSLVLAFPADHLFEVKQWILSWGRGAEVMAPETLVREVKEELSGMRQVYGMLN